VIAALLVWMGLVLASPALEPAATASGSAVPPAGVARVRLGASDLLGERMFGRALHRRRILLAEPAPAPRERFDLPRWLRSHGAALR